MISATELACGNWHAILPRLGIHSSFLQMKHGPCPNCGGKDRFRFDDKNGTGSYYCNQCGPGDGMSLLMKVNGINFAEAAKQVERLLTGVHTPARQIQTARKAQEQPEKEACRRLWKLTQPVTQDDAAGRYLLLRGIGAGLHHKSALRFHPALNYVENGQDHKRPALIAKIDGPDGNGVNLQRIYLSPEGRKAPVQNPKKLMKGALPAGSAVRLGGEAETMGIAEGVETALAASILHGVPVWAAIHAAGLQNWIPPVSARAIIIFADHDANQAGQRAAQVLSERLKQRGLQASICMPTAIGQDWNDVLSGAA